MKQIISDISEQMAELGQSTKKSFINDVIKGIPKAAKQQIMGQQVKVGNDQVDVGSSQENKDNKANKTIKASNNDPITGKPAPTKKTLTQLTEAEDKLKAVKLQRIREELARQRIKTKNEPADANPPAGRAGAMAGETGPQVKIEEKKPDPGAVARTLKQSQQTGEFKGSVGG